MSHDKQMGRTPDRKGRKVHAVRFPSRTGTPHPSSSRPLYFWGLLPRAWRRRVVIRGRHFWLPG